jgi:IclR family acetate operon transcriptional repressor
MKTGDREPILKALKVLSWMIQEQSDEVGVREIATGLGISPSTAHRLLSELVNADFVRPGANSGRYSLSLEFFRLAYLTISHLPIIRIALNHLRRLTDACNETSLLALYDNLRQEMMFVAMIESTHLLRYSIELNKWLPVYRGASGLAIMAFLSDAEVASILERARLAPPGSSLTREHYKIEAALRETREKGYAITHGQRIAGAVGLAAPVFGSRGELVADVCLTIPASRFDVRSEETIAGLLMTCAKEVTKAIGGIPQKESYL